MYLNIKKLQSKVYLFATVENGASSKTKRKKKFTLRCKRLS